MIELKFSDLELRAFFITSLNIDFVEVYDEEKGEFILPDWGEFMYDYEILTTDDKVEDIRIEFTLVHECPDKSSGFNLKINTTSFFNLKLLDKKSKDQAIFYTCFPVILGNIRGSMLSVLAQFPAVNRDIPLFDLKDMVKKALKEDSED